MPTNYTFLLQDTATVIPSSCVAMAHNGYFVQNFEGGACWQPRESRVSLGDLTAVVGQSSGERGSPFLAETTP